MENPVNEAPLEFVDFIRLVLEALEATQVEYMIGGAVAAWVWGEARTTRDLDVVISLPVEKIGQLSEELKKRDMLVPPEIILDLYLEDRADLPISAIHLHSGYKAELFLLKPHDELRRSAFARRRCVDIGPPLGEVYVHAPEDLILYKLWYFDLGGQTKHLRDIASILLAQGDTLDFDYIERWASREGLQALWQEMCRQTNEEGKQGA